MLLRTQLRGNCQCCGHDQAVMDGHMAHHGYTIECGYFQGKCGGHLYGPLQVQRVVADSIVKSCREDAVRNDMLAQWYANGTKTPKTVKTNRYDAKTRDYVRIPFETASAHEQQKEIGRMIYSCEARARQARSFADQLERLANELHGQPLREVPVEAPPAAIPLGEKRMHIDKVCTVVGQSRGCVVATYTRHYSDKTFRIRISLRTWRSLPFVE